MAHRSEDIRNIALIGHSNSGKTALIDALAFLTKVSSRHGNSADGTSISDTDPDEKERRHTLGSHLFSFTQDGIVLNVVDTAGHPDFAAGALAALQVVEAGFLCVNASTGVTFHARRLFHEAGQAGIGRAVVVCHPDAENLDFDSVYESVVEAFGDTVVPVTYPDATGSAFSTVHDVMEGQGPNAAAYKERLAERIAEADDEILEQYLESGELSDTDFEKYLPLAISKQKVTPLFTVCAPKEIGLRKLFAFVGHYFPSPIAFGPRPAAADGSDALDQLVEPDPAGPFAGVVFKTVVDPYVGRQSFIRCFRGSLTADSGLYNVRSERHAKLAGVSTIVGGEIKALDRVVAGDLFMVAKVEDLNRGDSVTADDAPLRFPDATFPRPVYSLAVNPASRGDEQKISQGLEKLAAEDPMFHVRRDPTTGELVISGSSPIHLDITLGRLKRRYGVATEHHAPKIPFNETVTVPAEGHHRHKKQSGGRGQFAEVFLRIKPKDRGEGFEFVDSVVGGSIPRQFIPEVEKGIRKFLAKGGLAGCTVVDVQAEVYDGKFHDVDSDQLSFQLAGERAFADAFQKARPILLEPIMDVEIHVPERFTGDVSSNLATLRGRMSGMQVENGIQTITAQVPLKEMQDYSTQLRSITAGEGTFTMSPSHLEPVPPNVQQEIIAAMRRAEEAK